MADIISVLPDHVANQIAAGEVVQRPASVVKELIENAIDAGATEIKLIIKDAGKTLIQVIDNGKGMSPFDTRLAFERHATSKIKTAEDLFRLHTKGFRGEALASISAVAQVELKTKQENDEAGQHLLIDGGKFIRQENCQCPTGSNFMVKNLFFNIPARRNFLKDDSVELKHIIHEFERIALPHHNIHFSLFSNNNQVYHLPPASLLQRIMGMFGNSYQQKLVSVEEATPYLKVSGYVGKPEMAKKTKKDQYFFINNRFIRSPYLSTAVYEAFKNLISIDAHPAWFIFLDIEPSQIDVNIHPTKTEIKFMDDKTVFITLLSIIKRALGKANIGPSIDFDTEPMTDVAFSQNRIPVQPKVTWNTDYNPFNTTIAPTHEQQQNNVKHWESMFLGFNRTESDNSATQEFLSQTREESIVYKTFQLYHKYIVCNQQDGILIIDQQRAHERILYEHFLKTKNQTPLAVQQILFPEQVEFSHRDFQLMHDLIPEFKLLGFDIEVFGKNNMVINGVPTELENQNIQLAIENILEAYKLNTIDAKLDVHDNLCQSLAKSTAIKNGKPLEESEMQQIISHLMHCENNMYTADGKTIFMQVNKEIIEKHFKKQ